MICTNKYTVFKSCQFQLVVTLSSISTYSSSRPLVNSSRQSISILSFEMSMAGGSNLLKVGQLFQFVRQQFFFKLPPNHFFSFTPGHETDVEPFVWWPTFPQLSLSSLSTLSSNIVCSGISITFVTSLNQSNLPTFLCGCGSWKRWGSFLFSSSWGHIFEGSCHLHQELHHPCQYNHYPSCYYDVPTK